jgi:hypothetical protein
VYPEVLGDLAAHMLGTMAGRGLDAEERVDSLWESYAVAAEQAGAGEAWAGEEAGEVCGGQNHVCEELESYLKDTFDWFDARQCGYLNPKEFLGAVKGVFCKQGEQRQEVETLQVVTLLPLLAIHTSHDCMSA